MIHYQDKTVTLHHGDCLDVLRELPDASIDAVVTDPPYGLEFMGREWDAPWKAGGSVVSDPADVGGFQDGNGGNPFSRSRIRFGVGPGFQQWCEQWATETLRVLKPGGHLLAFGGTRTWHRLACAIEDAGFEIRDSIHWIYSTGFPKSLNVNKSDLVCRCQMGESSYGAGGSTPEHDLPRLLDADVPPPVPVGRGQGSLLLASVSESGASADRSVSIEGAPRRDQPSMEGRGDLQAAEGELHRAAVRTMPARVDDHGAQGRVRDGASADHGAVGRSTVDPDGVRQPHRPEPAEQRAVEPGAVPDERGPQAGRGWPLCERCGKPAVTPGLGTALKPAHEPIIVARKPLDGTVAANVLRWGTGALNVDGCRVEGTVQAGAGSTATFRGGDDNYVLGTGRQYQDAGRWPPNLVLSPEAAAELDRQSGTSKSVRNMTLTTENVGGFDDEGGASRFFPIFRYEPKAPTSERPRVAKDGANGRVAGASTKSVRACNVCGNRTCPPGGSPWPACGHDDWEYLTTQSASVNHVAHPTVKPLDLMRWLVRLVTPPDGLVLDPFAGSGTTGEAAILEHKRAILIEREGDYLPLIVARLSKPIQVGLFVDEDGAA